jgi:protein-tyrosine phosphatase
MSQFQPKSLSNVLVVCKGNICRSPFAEAVLSSEVRASQIASVHVWSRGTENYHVGKGADRLATRVAHEFGVDLSTHVAKQLAAIDAQSDAQRADLILLLDSENRARLLQLFPNEGTSRTIRLLGEFLDPPVPDIPDPYRGSEGDFRKAFGLVSAACRSVALQLSAGRRW